MTIEEKNNDEAISEARRKEAMRNVVSVSPTLPKFNKTSQPVTNVEAAKLRKEGEKRDPIAGRLITEKEKRVVSINYDLNRAKQLKVYAALNGLKLNDILTEAVDQWITRNADKLPDV